MKNIKREWKTYECKECGLKQQELHEIGKHKQSIHTLCEDCGYCTDFKLID
ncbi:MAG: hypothetical protein LBI03_03795 [Clostridiales bacterium]|jgi:uncharacterized Zn finger protein|nr:hypothetical protein [Clostridiales bacterium]